MSFRLNSRAPTRDWQSGRQDSRTGVQDSPPLQSFQPSRLGNEYSSRLDSGRRSRDLSPPRTDSLSRGWDRGAPLIRKEAEFSRQVPSSGNLKSSDEGFGDSKFRSRDASPPRSDLRDKGYLPASRLDSGLQKKDSFSLRDSGTLRDDDRWRIDSKLRDRDDKDRDRDRDRDRDQLGDRDRGRDREEKDRFRDRDEKDRSRNEIDRIRADRDRDDRDRNRDDKDKNRDDKSRDRDNYSSYRLRDEKDRYRDDRDKDDRDRNRDDRDRNRDDKDRDRYKDNRDDRDRNKFERDRTRDRDLSPRRTDEKGKAKDQPPSLQDSKGKFSPRSGKLRDEEDSRGSKSRSRDTSPSRSDSRSKNRESSSPRSNSKSRNNKDGKDDDSSSSSSRDSKTRGRESPKRPRSRDGSKSRSSSSSSEKGKKNKNGKHKDQKPGKKKSRSRSGSGSDSSSSSDSGPKKPLSAYVDKYPGLVYKERGMMAISGDYYPLQYWKNAPLPEKKVEKIFYRLYDKAVEQNKRKMQREQEEIEKAKSRPRSRSRDKKAKKMTEKQREEIFDRLSKRKVQIQADNNDELKKKQQAEQRRRANANRKRSSSSSSSSSDSSSSDDYRLRNGNAAAGTVSILSSLLRGQTAPAEISRDAERARELRRREREQRKAEKRARKEADKKRRDEKDAGSKDQPDKSKPSKPKRKEPKQRVDTPGREEPFDPLAKYRKEAGVDLTKALGEPLKSDRRADRFEDPRREQLDRLERLEKERAKDVFRSEFDSAFDDRKRFDSKSPRTFDAKPERDFTSDAYKLLRSDTREAGAGSGKDSARRQYEQGRMPPSPTGTYEYDDDGQKKYDRSKFSLGLPERGKQDSVESWRSKYDTTDASKKKESDLLKSKYDFSDSFDKKPPTSTASGLKGMYELDDSKKRDDLLKSKYGRDYGDSLDKKPGADKSKYEFDSRSGLDKSSLMSSGLKGKYELDDPRKKEDPLKSKYDYDFNRDSFDKKSPIGTGATSKLDSDSLQKSGQNRSAQDATDRDRYERNLRMFNMGSTSASQTSAKPADQSKPGAAFGTVGAGTQQARSSQFDRNTATSGKPSDFDAFRRAPPDDFKKPSQFESSYSSSSKPSAAYDPFVVTGSRTTGGSNAIGSNKDYGIATASTASGSQRPSAADMFSSSRKSDFLNTPPRPAAAATSTGNKAPSSSSGGYRHYDF